MALKTYNLAEVAISINGIEMTGFGENDAITVEYAEQAWQTVVGADGEVTRSRTNNELARATLTLMQTAVANAALQAAVFADKEFGTNIFAFSLEDLQRSEVLFGSDCYIEQSPTKAFNKAAAERVWVIVIPVLNESPLSGFDPSDFGFPP